MQFQDRLAEEAFSDVATLLANAYQRLIAMRRVPAESPVEPAANELDMSSFSSLHEE